MQKQGRKLEGLSSSASTCSYILPAHVGARVKKCKYPHAKNGWQSKITHHKCMAARTIYVPLDPSIRMACILPDHKEPHNHPILPARKASRNLKDQYRKCIQAAGIAGNTVCIIDNVSFFGFSPKYTSNSWDYSVLGLASLSEGQKVCVRQQIMQQEKKKVYPHGLGIEGIQHIMKEDLKSQDLPLDEQYIHSMKTTLTGATLVFTADPFLLGLIHFAIMIQ
ncbi:hypothetical protein B0H34DRAFT_808140, partial [Crassisporium funariophilum]